MRRLAGIFVAVALTALPATPSEAAVSFKPCVRGSQIECGELPVPLDRAGAIPGTVKLHVERLKARGTRTGALITLAGGPGQSATPFLIDWASTFFAAGRSRDLVVFDQRGTGLSGALRCRQLKVPVSRTPVGQAERAAACAQTLGSSRAFYATRDSVEDIEAVRQAIGVEKIALFGVSYGTKVALAYAARYPQRIERLVLDSVVEPTGPGAFAEESLAAIPRVLRTLCIKGCEDITPDPVADVAALVQRVRTQGFVYGPLVSAKGRRQRARIGSVRLLDLLFAGDFDPTLRAHFPGAVRSALTGDAAPLLRLALRAERGESPAPVEFLSDGLYAATVCEEGPLGWARTTPIGARLQVAEARLRALPSTALYPFDRTTALFASATVQLCSRWPSAPAEPAIQDGPFPATPTLVLAGEDDLRTPLESARRIAARVPGSTLVQVSEMGHSVLDGFPRTCGLRTVDDFFSGRPLRRCAPRQREFPPVPMAPRSVSELAPQVGVRGRAGRTVSAVALTLIDTLDQVFSAALVASPDQDVLHVGGLRAGYARAGLRTLEFHGVQFVPGVRVAGTLRITGKVRGVLRVTGRSAARGRLVFRKDGSVRGRLGGKRVRVSRAVAAGRLESRAWRVSEALSRWANRSTRPSSGSSARTSWGTTPYM
jgi:pimeloyl-ACP methyl ester carboxylesterase